jgi:hypothetical protein
MMQTRLETIIRKEEKMDADRGTGNGAGMEATPDGGDIPARDAVHKARGRPFERGKSGNPNGRPRAIATRRPWRSKNCSTARPSASPAR